MENIKIHRPNIQNVKSNNSTSVGNNKQYIPDDHKEFAKNLEAQFSQLMFKEMQKAVPKTGTSNTANQFYDSLMLQERAKAMSERGGSKIQEMLLDEVYPQKFRNKANYDQYAQSKNRFNDQKIEMHDRPSLGEKITTGKPDGVSHD